MDSTKRPFQINSDELDNQLNEMVSVTFSDITSQFLLLPKGSGFIEYPAFSEAYEVLRQSTSGFENLTVESCLDALTINSRSLGVLRAILGMTPPEWAELASEDESLFTISQNAARTLDRNCREDSQYYAKYAKRNPEGVDVARVKALIATAITYITKGASETSDEVVHRLGKVDTNYGLESLTYSAREQVPYSMLLYERYLGRPFASHRDAISELVGEVMENAVEELLRAYGVTYRKTKRAEKIPGFGQAPDFCIPDEINPAVIIEAKITSDDGTARDKISRIKVLAQQKDNHAASGKMGRYQVIACIDGRGFKQRKEDMKQLLKAVDGKVFTTKTLDQLIEHSYIQKFATKKKSDSSTGW